VGATTVGKLPKDFTLHFKIADTRYNAATAVNELMKWMYHVEEKGSCLTAVNVSTLVSDKLHAYESREKDFFLDAVIGGFNSEVCVF